MQKSTLIFLLFSVTVVAIGIFMSIHHSKNPSQHNIDLVITEKVPIIEKFMPVFYLTKNECFKPMTIDAYLAGSTLVQADPNGKKQAHLIKRVNQEEIYEMFKNNPNSSSNYSFVVDDPTILYGFDDVSKAPIYTNVVTVGNNTYINYILFHGFNGWYEWKHLLEDKDHYRCQGAHTSDIERCTLHIDSTGKLKRVMYGRHGSEEQQWVDAKDVEMENGHPVVYVAWRGHGCYQRAGKWYRTKLPKIPDDKTPLFDLRDQMPEICEKGIRWFPLDNYRVLRFPHEPTFDPKLHGIMVYKGNMGFDMNDLGTFTIFGWDSGVITGVACRHLNCQNGMDDDTMVHIQDNCSFGKYPCLKKWPMNRGFNKGGAVRAFAGKDWVVGPQTQQTGDKLPYQ